MPTSKQSRSKAVKKSRQSDSSPRSKSAPARKKKPIKKREPALRRIAISPLVEARDSDIHGKGVYAVAPIKKGTRIIEYIGERISHQEADRRYELKGADDGHTFLFIASNRTVIDATAWGNDARFVNHSCSPNCETVIEKCRVFVEAIRNIKPGEELGYDYQLTWYSTDEPEDLALYACRCGTPRCRGTMLDRRPIDKPAPTKANSKSRKKK